MNTGRIERVEPFLNIREQFRLAEIAHAERGNHLGHLATKLLERAMNPLMVFVADDAEHTADKGA